MAANGQDGVPSESADRAAALAELIRYHRERYYSDEPEIADGEYDELERELKALEAEYPQLREGSPLEEVGGVLLVHVLARPSRRAHVLARQRVRPRRAPRVVRTRRASDLRSGAVRRRAQARRARHVPAVRGRPPHPSSHPRRRRNRRRRHREHPHDRSHTARPLGLEAGGAGRSPRRGVHAPCCIRGAQQATGRGG